MNTFKDFLLTGKLGPISLGDSDTEVREKLGEPSGVSAD